jgi:hypothetical protein
LTGTPSRLYEGHDKVKDNPSRSGNTAVVLVLGAFALSAMAGTIEAFQFERSNFSPRLGIYYDWVRYGSAYGARLTEDPVPGSPLLQEQIQLERGDIITHLDNTPIAGPAELENHHGQTAIAFVNIRTHASEARWLYLPAMGAPTVPSSADGLIETRFSSRSSPRLGINYEWVRYGAAYGARLTDGPLPGSPLLQEQIQLERGDMITHLDNMPISGSADLENHHGQTAVAFVNVRTGQPQANWAFLPAMNAAVPGNSFQGASEPNLGGPQKPVKPKLRPVPAALPEVKPLPEDLERS